MFGLQNYVNYERMNLDLNDAIEKLWNYEKFKYRFLIENLLFSSNLENSTNVIFVTCNGLTNAKDALINSKIYKTLGVVYLSKIKNWNLVKSISKRSQAIFTDSEYHTKSSLWFCIQDKKRA